MESGFDNVDVQPASAQAGMPARAFTREPAGTRASGQSNAPMGAPASAPGGARAEKPASTQADARTQAARRTANGASLPLPAHATHALSVLEAAGHEAWCVGGFVRDGLLGRPCADIDIATDAPWQSVKRAFEAAGHRVHETGTAHGTVTVVVDGVPVEVTTYRADGAYADARHPERVSFVGSIQEDLARRDFTVNALAYHPKRGILDPFGGMEDLSRGVLRAVGDPQQRFGEDALRILRACRFASQLGFSIEDATFAALLSHKHLLNRISAERITHELDGFLRGAHVHDALMLTVDVLAMVLPELVAMKGLDQRSPYHIYDVLEHTAWTLQYAPDDALVRWAALFHDAGKPAAFFVGEDGVGHAYGHAHVSVRLARAAFGRLRLPGAFCERALALVAHHDDVVDATPKAVKREIARLGGDPSLFAALCKLKRADSLAHAPSCAHRVQLADQLEETLADVLAAGEAFSRKSLAINGNDVLALGVPRGRMVGEALDAALQAVIDDEVENSREALCAFVRGWMAEREDATHAQRG